MAISARVGERRQRYLQAPAQELRPAPLPPLTGLRILASVLVVVFHFLPVQAAAGAGPWPWLSGVIARIVASGYTGVSFFFVLSGFILAYSYLGREGRLRGTTRRFYWARVARIYPVYLFALLVGLVPLLQAFGPQFTDPRLIPALLLSPLLLQGWLPYAPVWDPPTWSLSAEAFFYALFPLVVPLVGRLRRRHLPLAALGFWAVAALVVAVYVVADPDRGQHSAWYDHYWLRMLYDNPLARLPEFFLGVVAGRLFVTRSGAGTVASARADRRAGWLSIAAAVAIVSVWGLGPFPVALANPLVLDPLFAMLVYSVAFGRGPIAAIFSWPSMVALGEASYALYLLQWPVHDWMARFYGPLTAAVAPVQRDAIFFAAYLCILVAASLLAYHVIERPARRVLRRAIERGRRSPAVTAEDGAAPRRVRGTVEG